MPTIDGGHLFLSCVFPVREGELIDDGRLLTHAHKLREELSLLPTAQQSAVTVQSGLMSPFAQCPRTHFLRLFVIDQPMFNGRDPVDPLLAAVTGKSPQMHQRSDRFRHGWLVLSADIDRAGGVDEGLSGWAEGLWHRTEPEMRAIFSHCHGFDKVETAAHFAAYIKRCQIETTMSFNDYWQGRPPLKGFSFGALGQMVLGVAVLVLLLGWWFIGPSNWWVLLWLLPGLLLGVGFAAFRLDRVGRQPFPAAPDSDLPSVLKSLYVQQRFAFFAEAMQGMTPEVIHRSFGQFLDSARPEVLDGPTQPRGVIRGDGVDLAIPESLRASGTPDNAGDVSREAALKAGF